MKRQWKTFVDEMIMHGDPTKAYMAAYPKAKVTSARVKSYNLLQNVTISELIKENSEKITAIATEKAIDELKDKIVCDTLTTLHKREILFKIASGELKTEKVVFTKDGANTIMCKPSHSDIMQAIDLDNKMTGDNAPVKTDNRHLYEVEIQDDA